MTGWYTRRTISSDLRQSDSLLIRRERRECLQHADTLTVGLVRSVVPIPPAEAVVVCTLVEAAR